jgi:hypothetical protein
MHETAACALSTLALHVFEFVRLAQNNRQHYSVAIARKILPFIRPETTQCPLKSLDKPPTLCLLLDSHSTLRLLNQSKRNCRSTDDGTRGWPFGGSPTFGQFATGLQFDCYGGMSAHRFRSGNDLSFPEVYQPTKLV